jgi:Flp pilus assembly CpaF family ATPase
VNLVPTAEEIAAEERRLDEDDAALRARLTYRVRVVVSGDPVNVAGIVAEVRDLLGDRADVVDLVTGQAPR